MLVYLQQGTEILKLTRVHSHVLLHMNEYIIPNQSISTKETPSACYNEIRNINVLVSQKYDFSSSQIKILKKLFF